MHSTLNVASINTISVIDTSPIMNHPAKLSLQINRSHFSANFHSEACLEVKLGGGGRVGGVRGVDDQFVQ